VNGPIAMTKTISLQGHVVWFVVYLISVFVCAFQPAIISQRISTHRPVIIYNGEGYIEEESSSHYSNTRDSDSKFPMTRLMERLSTHMGTLARVAAAFSPSHLELQSLKNVQVTEIDETHIELAAIVCDDQDCVQVPVPITFPMTCSDNNNLEECVLENLQILDSQAHRLISNDEWRAQHTEELDHDKRISRALKEEPGYMDFPVWWTFPTVGLIEECTSIKSLLNEDDFRNELVSIAQQFRPALKTTEIAQAAVAAVGPSGMIIRASVKQHDFWEIVDVPISFDGIASSSDDLRGFVLGLVSSVS